MTDQTTPKTVEVRFYIDCEFDGHDGPLLSLAMVREDGHSIHIRTTATYTDPWVIENVIPLMDKHQAKLSQWVPIYEVGPSIRHFIGDCVCPVIIADSPVDIGRFCRALSTGSDKQWASADYPAMRFEVHNVDCYPTTLPGAVQHNAWWDAMALRHRLAHRPAGKPVAWMYEKNGRRHCHGFRLKSSGKYYYGEGWTETPLYPHPALSLPDQGEVERLHNQLRKFERAASILYQWRPTIMVRFDGHVDWEQWNSLNKAFDLLDEARQALGQTNGGEA